LTLNQLRAFGRVLDECALVPGGTPADGRPLIHAANSAGLLRFRAARFDMVRPGLALYGAWPADAVRSEGVQLKPVMTLRSRVTNVQQIPRGRTVSYGATWRATVDSRLALIPVGYADGYSRHLSNRGEVLIRGLRCPVVGRVTMDQVLVDCTHLIPNVQVGEDVTLFGNGLPVEDVAGRAGTIAYQILCGVASRVPRVYVR
jgi:alanine racemase